MNSHPYSRRSFLFWILTFLFLFPQAGFTLTFQSDVHQTALIELYTSEGCSSCVPADERMGEFAQEKGLWKNFVPVVFHVDYWDYLGWKDRFAKPAFVERQKTYAAGWNGSSIYTPSFVLNGEEWMNWPEREGFPPELKKAAEAGILKVESEDLKNFSVEFTPKLNLETESIERCKLVKKFCILIEVYFSVRVSTAENPSNNMRKIPSRIRRYIMGIPRICACFIHIYKISHI